MLTYFKNYVVSLLKQKEGQGMVEYALLLGFISVAAIAILILLGPKIATMFSNVNNQL